MGLRTLIIVPWTMVILVLIGIFGFFSDIRTQRKELKRLEALRNEQKELEEIKTSMSEQKELEEIEASMSEQEDPRMMKILNHIIKNRQNLPLSLLDTQITFELFDDEDLYPKKKVKKSFRDLCIYYLKHYQLIQDTQLSPIFDRNNTKPYDQIETQKLLKDFATKIAPKATEQDHWKFCEMFDRIQPVFFNFSGYMNKTFSTKNTGERLVSKMETCIFDIAVSTAVIGKKKMGFEQNETDILFIDLCELIVHYKDPELEQLKNIHELKQALDFDVIEIADSLSRWLDNIILFFGANKSSSDALTQQMMAYTDRYGILVDSFKRRR